jgi:osmotically-inducible protein OsmY
MSLSLCVLLCGAALYGVGCAGDRYRESTGEYIDDSTITTKVKAKLAKDPVVSAMQVKVETFKGVVQLSGFVDSQEQVDRAVQLARDVKGVQEVKNNISVKPR